MSLNGMEMMIDFDGTTYKSTLRAPAPNSKKSYFFDMTSMRAKEKLPRTVSVAPIFFMDAREVLGEITSKVSMPHLRIVKNYTDLIVELEEKDVTFINITEEVEEEKEVSNMCDNFLGEDPWGGCPIAAGEIYSVYYNAYDGTFFDFEGNASNSWEGKGIKFRGEDCVVSNNTCVEIVDISEGSLSSLEGEWGNLIISEENILTAETKECSGNNAFYVYESLDCN